ncbi:hypothetical protein MOD21_01210, partial [Bacillus vallismortis]|nr:hypothetical protein [Bacillus vallismortis]
EYDTDVYLQSFYMVNELTDKYGKDIISEMIKETAKKGDFTKGFKSATNESLDQFEKDFKKRFDENSEALDRSYPMPLLLMKSLLAHAALSWRHLSLCRRK